MMNEPARQAGDTAAELDAAAFGRPASGWRRKLYVIIFESDTRAGLLFDQVLLVAILASVTVVMLDSVVSISSRYHVLLTRLEWLFTGLFTIEYVARLMCVQRPRRYARSLEPVPATLRSRGTSKSAVSRRFVAKTAAQLATWQTAALDALDLVGLLIDGVHIGEHCLIVALGIAADGQKHALGLWDGSTENARVCQDLLANLQGRGLRTDRSLLVILDGSKALRKAVRSIFGEAALVQRCQVHKTRNILEYLSDRDRPWAQAILRRAYQASDLKTAQRLLLDLARRLEAEYPSAAESVREGLDETLTVLTLNLSARLRRSLATTNAAESLLSRTRHVKRNVKRWRSGQMMLRWVAAGVLEAVKGFRRVKGYADMPMLVAALRARDRQLGLAVAQEERQIA